MEIFTSTETIVDMSKGVKDLNAWIHEFKKEDWKSTVDFVSYVSSFMGIYQKTSFVRIAHRDQPFHNTNLFKGLPVFCLLVPARLVYPV